MNIYTSESLDEILIKEDYIDILYLIFKNWSLSFFNFYFYNRETQNYFQSLLSFLAEHRLQ